MAWLHAFVDLPRDRLAAGGGFWGAALGWPLGEAWSGHPEMRSFTVPGTEPYVHLQEVGGPPRVHLDLEAAGAGGPDAAVSRAVALGASYVADHQRWRTLTSPGGLPFCVVTTPYEPGRPEPAPVTWPGGHRSRLVQLCIDSPARVHDREVEFWRALLAGRWIGSGSDEFAGTWHDDAGSPLQLLFQRLDEPEGPVRVHLDLGTDDVPAEVARLVGLGAADLGPGRAWHVLRDPAGLVFCVTGNDPQGTTRRHLG